MSKKMFKTEHVAGSLEHAVNKGDDKGCCLKFYIQIKTQGHGIS